MAASSDVRAACSWEGERVERVERGQGESVRVCCRLPLRAATPSLLTHTSRSASSLSGGCDARAAARSAAIVAAAVARAVACSLMPMCFCFWRGRESEGERTRWPCASSGGHCACAATRLCIESGDFACARDGDGAHACPPPQPLANSAPSLLSPTLAAALLADGQQAGEGGVKGDSRGEQVGTGGRGRSGRGGHIGKWRVESGGESGRLYSLAPTRSSSRSSLAPNPLSLHQSAMLFKAFLLALLATQTLAWPSSDTVPDLAGRAAGAVPASGLE